MPENPQAVISARGLTKTYGKVTALAGLDLDVPEGTVLGLLGPNGAGKTTAVSILTTLSIPDSGSATVAGCDVVKQPEEVRRRIGLSGQYAAVDETLTGFENLDMIGRLYRLGRQPSRDRARELLEMFDLAGALVAKPPVLFLDEPTTGLDPRSRTDLWQVIRDLVAEGTTLLLTTQYLEEADHLADEILVIDHGQAIARGTADQLKQQVGGERIEVTVSSHVEISIAHGMLSSLAVGEIQVDDHRRSLTVPITGGAAVLTRALRELDSAGVVAQDVGLRRPTLDDVFLTLTGHSAEEVIASPDRFDPDGDPSPNGASPTDDQQKEAAV